MVMVYSIKQTDFPIIDRSDQRVKHNYIFNDWRFKINDIHVYLFRYYINVF